MPVTVRLWREWPRAVGAVIVAAALLVLLGVLVSSSGGSSPAHSAHSNAPTVRVPSKGPVPAQVDSHVSAAAASKIHRQAQQITALDTRLTAQAHELTRVRLELARARHRLHARHIKTNPGR